MEIVKRRYVGQLWPLNSMGDILVDVILELLGVTSQGLKIGVGEPRVGMLTSHPQTSANPGQLGV